MLRGDEIFLRVEPMFDNLFVGVVMVSGGLPSFMFLERLDDGGDRIPNLSGTDWPNGPNLAICGRLFASNEAGSGALRADLMLSVPCLCSMLSPGGDPN